MTKLWLWRVGVFPQISSPTVFLFPFPAHKLPPLFSMIIIGEAPKSNQFNLHDARIFFILIMWKILCSFIPASSMMNFIGGCTTYTCMYIHLNHSELLWSDMTWHYTIRYDIILTDLTWYEIIWLICILHIVRIFFILIMWNTICIKS